MSRLDDALDAFKAILKKYGIDTSKQETPYVNGAMFTSEVPPTTYDAEWRNDAKIIKEMILREGVTNTLGAFVEALNFIEADRGHEDGEEFYESQECKNLDHCKQVIEHVMTACDLDVTYGYGEARKVAMERLKNDMRETDTIEFFKEQA